MNDLDVESTLHTLRWKSPAPEFLQRSLEAALCEREAASKLVHPGVENESFPLTSADPASKERGRPTIVRRSRHVPLHTLAGLAAVFGVLGSLVTARRRHSLDAGSAETSAKTPFSTDRHLRSRPVLPAFLPAPVRWSLAACWLLALFFWWTTPDPVPASTREALAHLPPVNPELMLAQAAERQRLTDELLREISHSFRETETHRLP